MHLTSAVTAALIISFTCPGCMIHSLSWEQARAVPKLGFIHPADRKEAIEAAAGAALEWCAPPPAVERQGNNLRWFEDFCLENGHFPSSQGHNPALTDSFLLISESKRKTLDWLEASPPAMGGARPIPPKGGA